MTPAAATPFNQSIRIFALRGFFLLAVPLILFGRSVWVDRGWVFEIFEVVGLFLIIAGVLGRFWSILYIGGRKNDAVMQVGPYSICRHPLYLFSTVATVGFGMMLGSVVLVVALGGGVFAILSMTAAREEAYLLSAFGEAYRRYMARVPRIWPDLSLFQTPKRHDFDADVLRTNGRDALVFLSLIPLAELAEFLHETLPLPFLPLW